MFKKKTNWNKPFSEKIAKRIAKIPTAELETYVDQSLYEVNRNMASYGRSRETIFLDEALLGAEVLHAIVDEIYKRNTSK